MKAPTLRAREAAALADILWLLGVRGPLDGPQMADLLGYSKQRIAQIEHTAMAKLRRLGAPLKGDR